MDEKQKLIQYIQSQLQRANKEKDKNNSYAPMWSGKIAAYTEVLNQLRN